MTDNLLKSIYFSRKFNTIQFFRLNPEKSGIDQGLVYALSGNCFPYFHKSEEFEILKDCFTISEETIKTIVKHLNDKWKNMERVTFYSLEDEFSSIADRSDLITILRYTFLSDRFRDSEFWINLESDAPVEAHQLNAEFDIWEL